MSYLQSLLLMEPELNNIEEGYRDWKRSLEYQTKDPSFVKWTRLIQSDTLSKWAGIYFPGMFQLPKIYSIF